MKFFLYLLFFTQGMLLFGQIDRIAERLDSLDKKLKEDSLRIYRFRKIRPFLNYHNRNSINQIKPVNFYGFQFGAVFLERHIVGYGRYFSTEKTRQEYTYNENLVAIRRTQVINYHTAFYQFILHSSRWFEFHVPLEFGYGRIDSKYYGEDGFPENTTKENMFMTACGMQIILKPLRWCGITGNFGYRSSSEKLMNGFYYAVGFWIGLKPVMNDFTYHVIKRSRYKKAKTAILQSSFSN